MVLSNRCCIETLRSSWARRRFAGGGRRRIGSPSSSSWMVPDVSCSSALVELSDDATKGTSNVW